MIKGCLSILLLLFLLPVARAQRHYATTSVLASGKWYKISVQQPGVYKVDLPLLNKLGINTSGLSSASIRLFGNGGKMLPEACNGAYTDDLQENAIQVIDGGDGVLDGADYFLFYAPGPDNWTKDSVNHKFIHQKNLYSTKSYYYITIGGAGRRVQSLTGTPAPNISVSSFSGRYFHELDSVNLLNSGKNWYGEELSTDPGHTTSITFPVPLANIITSQPATLVSNCIARTIGGSSRFTVSAGSAVVLQQDIAPTGNTNFDLFAGSSQLSASFQPPAALSVTYNFTPGGINAQGWVDWFEVFCRRDLALTGAEQLLFRDWNSTASGNTAGFLLKNGAAAQVWDITDPANPAKLNTTVTGSDLSFAGDAASLHEYVAFSTGFLAPGAEGAVANQDLHNWSPADMLIIAYTPLLPQARRLAAWHSQQNQLKTLVVTTDQVFNEFSSGIPDPTALRDFVKMYYDKAGADTSLRPRYLLLFGDASFDYKSRLPNNSNFVPAYETSVSLDPLNTYTSDDYYGFLNDKDDINSTLITNFLDIGVGRVPAQTPDQAKAFVDKLINYADPKSLGPWRNQQTFIADDQDNNLHFNDAESITATAALTNPLFIQDKIYLDAYSQESTPSGSRYPDVNLAINNQVENGTLIWNYNGHGSYRRLADEVILEQPIVDTWTNTWRLPLFITATCDFAVYDNPAITSLGENILLRPATGGIALMTTTRLVFAYSNRIMNSNYLQTALQVKPDGSYPSLGEAVKQAKNFTYLTQTDISNNRKFTLLGDPALTIAWPKYRVQTTAINGVPLGAIPDTLKGLGQYTITGIVTDALGNPLPNFSGTLYATVFDKAQTVYTRGNDPDSYKAPFQVQHNELFKGKTTVQNDSFSFTFIVPKDINYQLGNGRISYYTDNGQTDGNGSFSNFLVGGSQSVSSDNTGPTVHPFLNDETFTNGMVVNETPLLLVHLADSSGINIMGTGIGHDITAMLDNDPAQVFTLNDFFESDLGSYRQGTVRFRMPTLTQGPHTLTVKAWDVANNSGQATIRFQVLNSAQLSISSLLNFPNPFSSSTTFRFDHNRPNENLLVTIRLFTVSGQSVKTIQQTINTPGNRSSDIVWDGTNGAGARMGPGIYFYQLIITGADGKTAMKTGRAIIY